MGKKAFTLVEVVVAMAILAVVALGVTATVLFVTRLEKANENYTHFETICLDIDKYSDAYGRAWDEKYYGVSNSIADVYYSRDYQVVETEEEATFILSYYYNSSNQLIVNVQEIGKEKKIIDNLNYGGRRYAMP